VAVSRNRTCLPVYRVVCTAFLWRTGCVSRIGPRCLARVSGPSGPLRSPGPAAGCWGRSPRINYPWHPAQGAPYPV
jgi:hypothetical protein